MASGLLKLIAEFNWDGNSVFSFRFEFFRRRKDASFAEDTELKDVERDVEQGVERGVEGGVERGVVFGVEPGVSFGVVRVESTLLGSSRNGSPSSLLIEDISDSLSLKLSRIYKIVI